MGIRSTLSDGASSKGLGCLALFALPFALVGLFMGYSAGRQLWLWFEVSDWDRVPATIERLELESHRGDDSTTYSLEARYSYTIDGRRYASERVWFSGGSDNLGDFHSRVYRELESARSSGRAACYVHPEDPESSYLARELRWPLLLFRLGFLLVFGGVGFGLLLAIPYIRRAADREAEMQARHPDEPWRWRPKWETNRIRSGERAGAWSLVGFALIWNAISWPIMPALWREAEGNKLVLIGLIFPLIGIIVAGLAATAVLRWRRFGASELELSPHPVPVGGRLSGRVLTSARLPRDREVRLRLDCNRREGSGKNSSNRLLWQHDLTLPATALRFDGRHTAIPISIDLPSDALSSLDDGIQWTLRLRIDLPGPDYAATFSVPVFETGANSAWPDRHTREEPVDPDRWSNGGFPQSPPLEIDRFAPAEGELDSTDPWPKGIAVEPLSMGGHRYQFGRNRFPGATFGIGFFLAAWFGFAALFHHLGAPRFFPIVFGLFGLLILWFFLDISLGRREIEADRRGLRLRHGLFFLGRAREVAAADVERLNVTRGTQIGNKLLQRLIVHKTDGAKEVAATYLDSLSVARRLKRHLERDLDRPGRSLS